MAKRFQFFCLLIILFIATLQAQPLSIKSPDEFLPYKLGSRFTPHHLLVDYFQYADGLSDKMQLVEYGRTYELRPLLAAIISSPANLKRIESIRQNNLVRTGMLSGITKEENIAIVYLSYSVHGNEAAGAESSMAVLYDLVKAGSPYESWLENTVVIMDPVLNPDGYNRYSQWSNSVSSFPNNPNPSSREHEEPWPGGRSNHYYFDLNRDWAWQSQQESRDRISFYLKWMPHVHADIHEMGAESPYYFAPAAQPYHQNVTDWQAGFQIEIGKNNASHFDQEGWRYFTKERYDLFYPSYGDTYPTFAGAIGMTYEQGGGGFANRAVILENKDTLTMYDRIAHHKAASLSTIEVSSRNASKLVSEFALYFKNSISDPPGSINSYVIKAKNHPGRIADFLMILRQQGITYGIAREDNKGIKGLSYLTGSQEIFSSLNGDIIVPASQPRSVLLHVLFEPEGNLADSMTYDMTAWCLPMAYGLDAYASEAKLTYAPYEVPIPQKLPAEGKPYAYAMQWGSVPSAQALAVLASAGIVARYASTPFRVDNIDYPAGTILLMRADNRKHPDFDRVVKEVADASVVPFSSIRTGFVESGKDLGSGDYALVRRPNVLALAGDGVRSIGVGEVWHFFEEQLKYPVNLISADELSKVDLENYNVVILTEGSYALNEGVLKKLTDWISEGGRLIAIGSATGKLAGKSGFALEGKETITPDTGKLEEMVHVPESYTAGERESLSEEIPGAIFQTNLDKTNPLTFGLGDVYWTLKTSTLNYEWLKSEGNAIYLDDTPVYLGFAGYKALEDTKKTMIAGLQGRGEGSVVYLVDNPLFRSMWNAGKILFSNALFF